MHSKINRDIMKDYFFLPGVGDCAKQTYAIGTSNWVASTEWHYRRHCLAKGLLHLLYHSTTGQLLNPASMVSKQIYRGVCEWGLLAGIKDLSSYLGPPCSTIVTGPTRWVTPPTLTAAVSNSLIWISACLRVLPRLQRVCAADRKLLLDT